MTRPLLRLLHHARGHRRTVRLATLCSVVNKIWDLAPPLLIGAAVDVVVEQHDSLLARLGIADPSDQLLVLAAATLLVWGAESLFEYFYAVLWRNLAQTVQHELRLDAYDHVQQLEMGFFDERSTGGLMAVLNDDVNQLERFLDGGANELIQVATTVVVIGAIFFYAAPTVAVFAILPMPFVLMGSFSFQARITQRYALVRDRVARLNARLSENLAGIATIKSFTAEARETEAVRADSQAYLEANRDAIRLSSAFTPLIRMVIVCGFVATLVLGGRMALDGSMAVGTYSVLVFMTQRLLWPLTRLGNTFDLYQRAMASTARVLDLLDTEVRIRDGDGTLPPHVKGALRFDQVDFAYVEGHPVLHGIDLHVPAGTTLGIVGPTGSGKSTLVSLLLRFHDPSSGRITLDGQSLDSVPLAELRAAVGLVSQRTWLFPGSVTANLAYGRPGADADDVARAARAAEAHDFVEALPHGYASEVGERGQRLSGGQAQRLAIARALVKDPPVLVLDEATSAVDNETEAAIQRALEHITRDRTTLIIAHRLSTVRGADRIVLLDQGRIAESGTHEDLVAAGGAYARLWAVQTGERYQGGVVPSARVPGSTHT